MVLFVASRPVLLKKADGGRASQADRVAGYPRLQQAEFAVRDLSAVRHQRGGHQVL